MPSKFTSEMQELAKNNGKEQVLKGDIVKINEQDFFNLRLGCFMSQDDPSEMATWMLDKDETANLTWNSPTVASTNGQSGENDSVYAAFGLSKQERAYETGNSKIELVFSDDLYGLEGGYNSSMMEDFYFYVIFDVKKNRFVKAIKADDSEISKEVQGLSWNQVLSNLKKLTHYPLGLMEELPRRMVEIHQSQTMPHKQAFLALG